MNFKFGHLIASIQKTLMGVKKRQTALMLWAKETYIKEIDDGASYNWNWDEIREAGLEVELNKDQINSVITRLKKLKPWKKKAAFTEEAIKIKASLNNMVGVSRCFGGLLSAIAQYALTNLLEEDDPQIKTSKNSFDSPAAYMDTQIDVNETMPVINAVIATYPTKIIEAALNYGDFSIVCYAASREEAHEWIGRLEHKMLTENQYRGKCLYAKNGHLIFHEVPVVTWDDVILTPEVKRDIRMNTVAFLGDERMAKAGVTKRGIMMYGIPGTGKTSICKAIFHELKDKGVSRIYVTAESFRRMSTGDLFNIMPYLGKVVLAFEDIDMVGTSREVSMASSGGGLLGDLLTNLDGMRSFGDQMVILASTNKMEMLDDALADRPGRFDRKIEIGLPTKENLAALYKKFSGMDVSTSIIDMSKGFTGSHVVETVNTAKILSAHDEKKLEDCLEEACDIIRENFFAGQTTAELKKEAKEDLEDRGIIITAEKENEIEYTLPDGKIVLISDWNISSGSPQTLESPEEYPEVEEFDAKWENGILLTNNEWDKYIEPNRDKIDQMIFDHKSEREASLELEAEVETVTFELNGDGMTNVHPHIETSSSDSGMDTYVFEMKLKDFQKYLKENEIKIDKETKNIVDLEDDYVYGHIRYYTDEKEASLKKKAKEGDPCSCGSGLPKRELCDARGIFCTYVCDKCEKEKASKYRKDVMEDSGYEANEQIEPDASLELEAGKKKTVSGGLLPKEVFMAIYEREPIDNITSDQLAALDLDFEQEGNDSISVAYNGNVFMHITKNEALGLYKDFQEVITREEVKAAEDDTDEDEMDDIAYDMFQKPLQDLTQKELDQLYQFMGKKKEAIVKERDFKQLGLDMATGNAGTKWMAVEKDDVNEFLETYGADFTDEDLDEDIGHWDETAQWKVEVGELIEEQLKKDGVEKGTDDDSNITYAEAFAEYRDEWVFGYGKHLKEEVELLMKEKGMKTKEKKKKEDVEKTKKEPYLPGMASKAKKYDPKKIKIDDIDDYIDEIVVIRNLTTDNVTGTIDRYTDDDKGNITEVFFMIDNTDSAYYGIDEEQIVEVTKEDKTLYNIGIEMFVQKKSSSLNVEAAKPYEFMFVGTDGVWAGTKKEFKDKATMDAFMEDNDLDLSDLEVVGSTGYLVEDKDEQPVGLVNKAKQKLAAKEFKSGDKVEWEEDLDRGTSQTPDMQEFAGTIKNIEGDIVEVTLEDGHTRKIDKKYLKKTAGGSHPMEVVELGSGGEVIELGAKYEGEDFELDDVSGYGNKGIFVIKPNGDFKFDVDEIGDLEGNVNEITNDKIRIYFEMTKESFEVVKKELDKARKIIKEAGDSNPMQVDDTDEVIELGADDEDKSQRGEQYKTLNDAAKIDDMFKSGTTEIWYMKDFKTSMPMHEYFLAKNKDKDAELPVKVSNIKDTHTLLGKISGTDLEEIFKNMQAEFWSPQGEAFDMITKADTDHTSMSVGDIMKVGDDYHVVGVVGFEKMSEIEKEGFKIKFKDYSKISDYELAKEYSRASGNWESTQNAMEIHRIDKELEKIKEEAEKRGLRKDHAFASLKKESFFYEIPKDRVNDFLGQMQTEMEKETMAPTKKIMKDIIKKVKQDGSVTMLDLETIEHYTDFKTEDLKKLSLEEIKKED